MMRRTKVKVIKKYVVLSLAVFLFVTGSAMAATSWGDATSPVAGTVQYEAANGGNVTIENNMYTDNQPLTLGAPPVPGVNITGTIQADGKNATVTAGTSGGVSNNFIINNQNTTTVTNVNFSNGTLASGNGGAIQNSANMTVQSTNPNQKTEFRNNTITDGRGGAIANRNGGVLDVNNALFDNNHAGGTTNGYGGAIYNNSSATGTSLTVTSSDFTNNSGDGFGGAVANLNGTVKIDSSSFTNNNSVSSSAGVGQGGAISNGGVMDITGNINKTVFEGNFASDMGGAIANSIKDTEHATILTIENATFSKNYTQDTSTGGGAIYNAGSSDLGYNNTLTINKGTEFKNNYSIGTNARGGAIYNQAAVNPTSYGDGLLIINGDDDNKVIFENNSARRGGAIANEGTANINNVVFNNNGKLNDSTLPTVDTSMGGAIYNQTVNVGSTEAVTTITNASFTNNTATNGGAIYNASGKVNVIDSDFSGNTATSSGGAVYGAGNSVTTLRAQNRDMTVGVENQNTNDTLVLATGATGSIDLQAAQGRTLTINSNIDTNNGTLKINNDYVDATGNTVSTGTVKINGNARISDTKIELRNGSLAFAHDSGLGVASAGGNGNTLNLYGGTLDLLNYEYGTNQLSVRELNLYSDTNIKLDVDLAGKYSGGTPTMDNILAANIVDNTNPGAPVTDNVNVSSGANLIVSGMHSMSDTDAKNVKILFTDSEKLIDHVKLGNDAKVINGPINKYSVSQVTQNVAGNPRGDNGEYFLFNRVGNSDNAISGPVAAQAAFMLMDNLYRQSFANMDMVTLMSPEERMAWKMRNRYASAYHTGVFAPNIIPEERDGFYVRPFSNFENVPLKNGPRVSNVSYGTLIGGDSDLIDLGHGWDGNFSFFGAYHGSHQAYNGVSIWQNGGTLGGVATAYKGNFWTGVTANIGASAAEAHHSFGNDQFPILMTGAAWKSGYNWGLFNNKVVVQPSYMMSYTFVNVFDYNSASGVKISQDPLNAIEIIPGLRVIGNFKNGWQPYAAVNMTWNIMDKTKFYANQVALTELAVKPYIEYGVGLQKRYGDRFTGFGQAMLRNGGRNGIALTLGLRWALGN